MKILSIDDQPLILLSLQKRLIELGYEVEIADSGQKGIDLFHLFMPDVVLVDINMPDISGIEVIEQIRNSSNPNVIVMIISGNIGENILKRTSELEVDDYMRKPVNLNEVASRINRLLEIKSVSEILEENTLGE